MPSRAAWPLALLCGVVCSLAFDPVGLPYAMVVGVAGLFVVAHRLADARKRVVPAPPASSFGLAFMGPLIWWMNAVSYGAYVALVLAETLFFAVVMLALRSGLPAAVVAAVGCRRVGAGGVGRAAAPVHRLPLGAAGPHGDRHAVRTVRPAARHAGHDRGAVPGRRGCWWCS